ncbi:hypothetical protein [Vibrio splendidus]|uniref:hypothetical protein n=1 Tax=Vibrio splendidus TaxID=29497 RepID=UPI000D372736|nr:hypothetical protein [Vibrio splendidus]PTO80141.1 hypothetical protein CWN84_00335 [Vibrio splendidus]
MKYSKLYEKAQKFTDKNIDGFECKLSKSTGNINDGVIESLTRFLSNKYASDADKKCFEFHHKLMVHLEQDIGLKTDLTFGYVDTGHSEWFKFEESDVSEWLNNRNRKKTAEYHVWLTLPSMEILDVSFPITVLRAAGKPISDWNIIGQSPDTLPQYRYYPVFVGIDLAHTCGLVGAGI